MAKVRVAAKNVLSFFWGGGWWWFRGKKYFYIFRVRRVYNNVKALATHKNVSIVRIHQVQMPYNCPRTNLEKGDCYEKLTKS